ncbi:MAG: hypothetical protein MUF01_15200 [Bryobacterales bacterium]|jgi:hypothetical protein|nr:hypothetical protein [Bryobacterales bacterium]
MVFEGLQAIIDGLQPIEAVVLELETKRVAMRATQENAAAVEAELEALQQARDAAEVAAAMEPTAANKRNLEGARAKVAECEERLAFAKARLRGFNRAIAEAEERLAGFEGSARAAKHQIVEQVHRQFAAVYHEALQQFLAVLALGHRLAVTANADVLRMWLHHTRLVELDRGDKVVADHPAYWRDIAGKIPPAELASIEETLVPVVAAVDAAHEQAKRAAEQRERNQPAAQPSMRPLIEFDHDAAERMRREREEREAAESKRRMEQILQRRGNVKILHESPESFAARRAAAGLQTTGPEAA